MHENNGKSVKCHAKMVSTHYPEGRWGGRNENQIILCINKHEMNKFAFVNCATNIFHFVNFS